jgi:hypothetical protein
MFKKVLKFQTYSQSSALQSGQTYFLTNRIHLGHNEESLLDSVSQASAHWFECNKRGMGLPMAAACLSSVSDRSAKPKVGDQAVPTFQTFSDCGF